MEKNDSVWKLISIAWELGYLIAVPLIVLAVLGKFADKFFQSSPLFFLICVIVSIIISSIIIYKKISIQMKDL